MSKRRASRVEGAAKRAKNGEIATMLHKDMIAHQKRTTDFKEGWKRALCSASLALASVSIFKAIEKGREGSPQWLERSITSANALVIGAGVWAEDRGNERWLRLIYIVALGLSVYQLHEWWTSQQSGGDIDFPVAVVLLVVAIAAVSTMRSTMKAADRAYQASAALAQKVSSAPNK